MTNMKVIIEVEKNFLEITNADTATATAAVRSFCNMLKTKQPAQSKIKVAPVVELPENPDDRIPVSAAALRTSAPAKLADKPTIQQITTHAQRPINNHYTEAPMPISVGDRPSANIITQQELSNLKHALENREEMVIKNGEPSVMETIRFTNTEPQIPLYRASYKCPTCGEEGHRFVRETNHYLKCHRCEAQLSLEKTVKDSDYLVSNEEGFFFHASKLAGRYNNNLNNVSQGLY